MDWMKIMYKLGRIFRRVDKTCADLNMILIVFAIGLATLDLTVFVTNQIKNDIVERQRYARHVPAQPAVFDYQSQAAY